MTKATDKTKKVLRNGFSLWLKQRGYNAVNVDWPGSVLAIDLVDDYLDDKQFECIPKWMEKYLRQYAAKLKYVSDVLDDQLMDSTDNNDPGQLKAEWEQFGIHETSAP